jgi:hypothetical protein
MAGQWMSSGRPILLQKTCLLGLQLIAGVLNQRLLNVELVDGQKHNQWQSKNQGHNTYQASIT